MFPTLECLVDVSILYLVDTAEHPQKMSAIPTSTSFATSSSEVTHSPLIGHHSSPCFSFVVGFSSSSSLKLGLSEF
ncbi:hypothetical protein TorRG33x02_166370 [Trema orientale]|uniref:Uncharacterized protein n=1 Tax=Trema orientale TaxID=63057 RepID=A0A2P5EQ25_TREOI|nr:hypothetical protein TorRG33x02_166370 [Trema orientale]